MADSLPGPARLSAFSDALFAVIITIMVLDGSQDCGARKAAVVRELRASEP